MRSRPASLAACWLLAVSAAGLAAAEAPAASMPGMSSRSMGALMGMDDSAAIGKLMLDQLEVDADSQRRRLIWDAAGWYGTDEDKIWLESEATPAASGPAEARNEALWDHVVSRWWSLRAGVRADLGQSPARGWASFGVAGTAPYRVDTEAALYVGDAGRTALRLRVERDLNVTQRLIAQPEIEAEYYSRSDRAWQTGAGLSEAQLGLRARYEIRRQLAPYAGVAWRREPGGPAQNARSGSAEFSTVEWVAGLRAWW